MCTVWVCVVICNNMGWEHASCVRACVGVHLLFSAFDWQSSWEMGLVSPLPIGPLVLLPPAGSPSKWGPCSQFWLW